LCNLHGFFNVANFPKPVYKIKNICDNLLNVETKLSESCLGGEMEIIGFVPKNEMGWKVWEMKSTFQISWKTNAQVCS